MIWRSDEQLERLAGDIRDLTREVAALKGERDNLTEIRNLDSERRTLLEEIERGPAEYDYETEGFGGT